MIATQALLEACILAARAGGAEILRLVEQGFDVERKDCGSPVTICDQAAEKIILAALQTAAPDVPVVAEEAHAAGRVPAHGDSFFLVDPLDGTKEFIKGGEDYTVNIGLIENGVPTLGVVYQPVIDKLWAGLEGTGAFVEEKGAERRAIATRARPEGRLDVVSSKSHFNPVTEDYLAEICENYDRVPVGSSLKFCVVAEGVADIYPRLAPTCEWDTAAGHAVLLAAGGRVDGPDGKPLGYDKPDYFNTGFCATAGWTAPAIQPWLDREG